MGLLASSIWLGLVFHGKGPFCLTPPSSGTTVLAPPLQLKGKGCTVVFRDTSLRTTRTSLPPGPGYRGENSMYQSRVSVYRQTCWCHRYFDGLKLFTARAPLAIAMACFSDKCQSATGLSLTHPASATTTMNARARSMIPNETELSHRWRHRALFSFHPS